MKTLFLGWILGICSVMSQEYSVVYQGKLPKEVLRQTIVVSDSEDDYTSEPFPTVDEKQNVFYEMLVHPEKSVFKLQDGIYNDTIVKIYTNSKRKLDTVNYIITREDKIIYKDRKQNLKYIHLKTRSGLVDRFDEYLFEQKLDSLDWQLTAKTKRILNYSCKMAIVEQGENMIIAWYAEDIKIQDGPSGFWGLPGLILGIHSKDFFFEATSVTKAENKHIITLPDLEVIHGYEWDNPAPYLFHKN